MGLGNRTANRIPTVYVQFSARDGLLYTTDKDPATGAKVKNSHEFVAGQPKEISFFEDEYQGERSWKMNVDLMDSDTRYRVTFNASTRQALELMGRLNNANVAEPLLIAGYSFPKGSTMSDGSERKNDLIGVTVRQGPDLKTKVAEFYNEELGDKQPGPVMLVDDSGKVVKIKGVEQLDKEATDRVRQELVMTIANAVNAKLGIKETYIKPLPQDGSIDPSEAAKGADQADQRSAMRARA